MTERKKVEIRIAPVDALTFRADALVLKYPQNLHGLEMDAFNRLSMTRCLVPMPMPGEAAVYPAETDVGANHWIFVGVQPLHQFGYAEAREFGRRALAAARLRTPAAEHIALTIHGPGFGLDEIEAFESVLAGIVEATVHGEFPEGLRRVTFVEQNVGRAKRLSVALRELLPDAHILLDARGGLSELAQNAQEILRSVGYASASKPRAFIAMPFASEMDDTFHYGIQGAIHAAGMLCERADLSVFTGDVMCWIKERIASARLVIADLSNANPNVYLEVGYAWGRGIPTVLLCKNVQGDLKFDVQGQRCLVYKSIKNLEELLGNELKALADLHWTL